MLKSFTSIISLSIFALFAQSSAFAQSCSISGDWYSPAQSQTVNEGDVLASLPQKGILLLGEHHTDASHHQWQMNVIEHLHNAKRKLILGLEMLPRSAQPVLDQWVNGELDRETFIKQSKWLHFWSDNFDDYFPILKFAKENKIPLVALNVSHELLQGIRMVGWEAVPPNHREGVGNPAKPSKDYVKKLVQSYTRHQPPNTPIDKVAFKNFYQQQLVWDRAMAEAIDKAISKNAQQLMVGLMGSWHVIDKQGVPHQLNDLGHKNVTTLIPWSNYIDCESLTPTFSDAVFGLSVTD